jgi:hypothetical protein
MCTSFFLVGNPERKYYLEDRRVDERMGSKKNVRKTGWKAVEDIHLAQYRGHWSFLVNTVMNLRVLTPLSS